MTQALRAVTVPTIPDLAELAAVSARLEHSPASEEVVYSSRWILVTEGEAAPLRGAKPLVARGAAWTDDFSNLWSVLR